MKDKFIQVFPSSQKIFNKPYSYLVQKGKEITAENLRAVLQDMDICDELKIERHLFWGKAAEEAVRTFLLSIGRSPKGARFTVLQSDKERSGDENFHHLVASVIDSLDDPDNMDEWDPLGFDIFRNGRGNYITEVILATGGPSVTAVYDSRYDNLEITGIWGAACFRIKQGLGDTSPLKEAIKAASENR